MRQPTTPTGPTTRQPLAICGRPGADIHLMDQSLAGARVRRPRSSAGHAQSNELADVTVASDAGLHVTLMIEDGIPRYSIEGMLRSLDIDVSARFTCTDDLPAFCDGPLIISSRIAAEPAPEPILHAMRTHRMHVVIMVNSTDAVDCSWGNHAHGFLDWADLCPTALYDAIVDVRGGRFHASASLVRRSVTTPDSPDEETASKSATMIALTAREHQVLRLIAEGLSNRQVARSLSISEHGVKRAVGIILAKLNCPNRTLAVVRAMEYGFLDM